MDSLTTDGGTRELRRGLLKLRVGEVPQKMRIWTARELLEASFPEPAWAIPGLLPEGLGILAGRPKLGKSFLALSLAIAVARGEAALGHFPLEAPGEALYLALEDNERRMQDRLAGLCAGCPEGLELTNNWPRGEAGVAALEAYLKVHPRVRLVVIDVWQRFTQPGAGRKSTDAYAEAYDAFTPVQQLALAHHAAVLVITHARKNALQDIDFLDAVLGSTGIAGSADTVLLLSRQRGSSDGVLQVAGRDLPDELELALRRDENGGWRIIGPAAEYALSQERQQVLEVVRRAQQPISPREIADALEIPPTRSHRIRFLLGRMLEDGLLLKTMHGKYQIKTYNTH